MASRFNRLTSTDLMFLRLETEAWPCHFGGFAVLDGAALLDESGQLRLDEIRQRLNGRLARVPDLRQRIHSPGLLGGKALWVDDDEFAIENHVRVASVEGTSEGLLETAIEIYGRVLDRARPLWEVWLLPGRDDNRVGFLLKLHHAVADGLAAVAIMGALFDLEADVSDPIALPWTPVPAPTRRELIADNLSAKWETLRRAAKRVIHPANLIDSVGSLARMTRGFFGSDATPAGSLNAVVGHGRKVRSLQFDLAECKQAARRHQGKVNDVVLALWSGGLRHLLVSRGEQVANVEVLTGMATTLRPSTGAGESIDNRVGTMMLRLPLTSRSVTDRIAAVVARTTKAKAEWRAAATMGYLAALAGTPIGHYFVTNQKASNTIVTNVMGPPVPVYLFGARVLEILPIIELVGNIGLTLCAFSYAGEMSLVVTADEQAFPDLDVLMEGMQDDWQQLAAAGEPPG